MRVYTKLRETTGVDRNTTKLFSEREGFSFSLLCLVDEHFPSGDLRCSLDEIRQVLLYPVCCLARRGICSSLIVKNADRSHRIVSGIQSIIGYEAWHLANDGHEALLDALYQLT